MRVRAGRGLGSREGCGVLPWLDGRLPWVGLSFPSSLVGDGHFLGASPPGLKGVVTGEAWLCSQLEGFFLLCVFFLK